MTLSNGSGHIHFFHLRSQLFGAARFEFCICAGVSPSMLLRAEVLTNCYTYGREWVLAGRSRRGSRRVPRMTKRTCFLKRAIGKHVYNASLSCNEKTRAWLPQNMFSRQLMSKTRRKITLLAGKLSKTRREIVFMAGKLSNTNRKITFLAGKL